MSCRCDDIYICRCNISKIEEIIIKINATKKVNDFIGEELCNLASYGNSTFYCVNQDDLMTQEKKLNDNVVEETSLMRTTCDNKIEELRDDLSSMQSEDSYFHEHEHDNEHHHDDDDD